jgi:hypothetical protein
LIKCWMRLVWVRVGRDRGQMDRSDEERAIGEVVDRLAKQFPQVPEKAVEQAVSQSRPEFDEVPIRDFVPLFVERGARARLRAMA